MHADGKSTLASVSKWNSVKVNSFIQIIKPEEFKQLSYLYTKLLTPKHWLQFADDATAISGSESDSKSCCALGCPPFLLSLIEVVAEVGVPLVTHLFSNKPTGTVAKAVVPLAICLFLSLSGVVAGVGVPLATHLFLINICGTVARAGVPLAVHTFF